jgi:ATP-dependent helicase/nuclease subunit A
MSEVSRLPSVSDLTEEQRAVVESWGRGLAVSAGAGSGKTTTLTLKCFELLRRNPRARLCAVSFTERSASDLRLKLGTLLASEGKTLEGEGGRTSGHWVMTIHGLCGTILREFPREAGFEGDERVLSDTEAAGLWKQACEALWSDGLAEGPREALDRLLLRETRENVLGLLSRFRALPQEEVSRSLVGSGDAAAVDLVLIALEVIGRYEKLKRRSLAMDFDDLEKGADRALQHERVRQILHRRFDLVLIDECQDTNPTQASILLRLARPDRSNLCVVGDAKQSIYRFRDADVTAFEKLCEELPVRLSLTWNFRSRPSIIRFVNAVCEPLFQASGLTYEGLVPRKAEREADSQASVEQVELSEGASDLAAWIRSEQARGVPLEEMALLLRQVRGGGARWLRELARAGIPLAVGSGGFFWQDVRVLELVAGLKAWASSGNTLSMATFLRAPWVGFSDSEMDRILAGPIVHLEAGSPASRGRERGRELWEHFLASSHWAAGVFSQWQASGGDVRVGEVLEALMAAAPLEIEAELGPAWLGLWHRAEELSADGRGSAFIVQEFSDSIEKARKSRDVPPPRNLGQLNVLTVHSSKGLEFKQVLLVDFPLSSKKQPDAPLLFWLPPDPGARLGCRTEEGSRDAEVERVWRSEELRRNLAEQKRLFYVALTRAQERLVLFTQKDEPPEATTETRKKKTTKAPPSPLEQDHWREWIRLGEGQLERKTSFSREAVGSKGILSPERETAWGAVPSRLTVAEVPHTLEWSRPRHSVTEWVRLAQCERSYEWTWIRPRVPATGRPARRRVTGDLGELSAAELGTEVHHVLETGDEEALLRLQARAGAKRLNSQALREGLALTQAEESMDGVEVWKELPFELQVEGQNLVGAMDRLVRTEAGDWCVTDFKVVSERKTAAELQARYTTQLLLYAYAVKRLDPAGTGSCSARIVAISPEALDVIPVPLPPLPEMTGVVERLARRAAALVKEEEGLPRPGAFCAQCDFRKVCPEAI